MVKIPKNQTNRFAQRAKQYYDQQEYSRIENINEQHSFYERMKGFKTFLQLVILPLLIFWSVLTEIAFAGSEFFNMTQSWLATIVLTIMVVLTVEALKLYVGVHFLRFFSQGWIKDGRHYFAFVLPSFLLFAAAYGASWLMSISAGPVISKNYNRYTVEVELISIDSIMQVYDAKVAPLVAKQEAASKTTWNGKIVEDALNTIAMHGQTIQQIEEQRTAAVESAEEENKNRKAENMGDYTQRGIYLQGFAGIGEGLQVILLLLFCLFERSSYIEQMPDEDHNGNGQFLDDSTTNPNIPYRHLKPVVVEGFLRGLQAYQPKAEQVVPTVQNIVQKPVRKTVREQFEQLVEQAVRLIPEQFRTANIEQESEQDLEQDFEQETEQLEQSKETIKTVIVSAPSEDISRWIHYGKIYYKRSIKTSSTPATRADNRERFEEYRDLVLATGKYEVRELKKEAKFIKKKVPKSI